MMRPRSALDVESLVRAFSPYVTKRLWMSYTSRMDGPVSNEELCRLSGLLDSIDRPLAQTTLVKVLTQVLSDKGGFNLSEAQKKDWAEVSAKRFRAAHRHWQDAKRRELKWAMKCASSSENLDAPAAPETPHFYYGFDIDKGQAWRAPVADTRARQWTSDIYAKPGADCSDDFCYARWDDGDEHQIPELTVGQLHARLEARSSSRASAALVSAEAPREAKIKNQAQYFLKAQLPSGEPIVVKTRKRQRAHTHEFDHWRRSAWQRFFCDFPTVDEAGEFMASLARMVVNGEIDVSQIYKKRDEMLQARGISLSKRRIAKKPAAAVTATKTTTTTTALVPDTVARKPSASTSLPGQHSKKRRATKSPERVDDTGADGADGADGALCDADGAEGALCDTDGAEGANGTGGALCDTDDAETDLLGTGVEFFDNECPPEIYLV